MSADNVYELVAEVSGQPEHQSTSTTVRPPASTTSDTRPTTVTGSKSVSFSMPESETFAGANGQTANERTSEASNIAAEAETRAQVHCDIEVEDGDRNSKEPASSYYTDVSALQTADQPKKNVADSWKPRVQQEEETVADFVPKTDAEMVEKLRLPVCPTNAVVFIQRHLCLSLLLLIGLCVR